MKAIILAAGVGRRIKNFTKDPKCLIQIKKEPLIIRTIKLLEKHGIYDVLIVVGYKANKVVETVRKHHLKARFMKNKDFTEGSILSLWCARRDFRGDILIIDGDLYFEEALIEKIVNSKQKNFFLIDSKEKKDKEAVIVGFNRKKAQSLARGLKGRFPVSGEWAGFLKLAPSGTKELNKTLERKIREGERKLGYEFIIPELFKKLNISYERVDGLNWVEIDYPKDVTKAKRLSDVRSSRRLS